jgi:hypothetical protein
VLSEERAAHRLAEEERRRRGAVVGAAAAVLGDATPELGEDEHHDLVRAIALREVVVEGRERVVDLGPEVRVLRLLIGMRVEAAEPDAHDVNRELGPDDLGRELQLLREPRARISGIGRALREDILQLGRRRDRLRRRAAHEPHPARSRLAAAHHSAEGHLDPRAIVGGVAIGVHRVVLDRREGRHPLRLR